MCSESKDEIQPCYYYPLLARHISDNNLDGKAIALGYTFTVNEALIINYSCKEKTEPLDLPKYSPKYLMFMLILRIHGYLEANVEKWHPNDKHIVRYTLVP